MNVNDKKNDFHQGTKQCICHGKQGLFFDKRQASRLIALLLAIGCFIFIAGYFWGQRTALDQLLNTVERDSFADQVYYSMCSLYDQKDDESNEPDAVSGDEESDQGGDRESAGLAVTGDTTPSTPTTTTYAAVSSKSQGPIGQKKYVAQLAGFGTLKNAEQLVHRLKRHGIETIVKKRISKTAHGKTVAWYQVVTKEYADKKLLDITITKIKRHEKIRDIAIIEI